MDLYGIYGEHTQEACPLYNEESRKYLLKVAPAIAKETQKYNVHILHQFHSGLEETSQRYGADGHTWSILSQ